MLLCFVWLLLFDEVLLTVFICNIKNHLLFLWVVKDLGVFKRITQYGSDILHRFSACLVGDMKLYSVGKELSRVKQFSYPLDGLEGGVGKEGDSRK